MNKKLIAKALHILAEEDGQEKRENEPKPEVKPFNPNTWLNLPGDSEHAFDGFQEELLKDLAPTGALQQAIADRIVTLMWRLRRIPALEARLVGENEPKHGTGLDFTRFEWPQAHLAIAKYESHLDRCLHKALKELKALQDKGGSGGPPEVCSTGPVEINEQPRRRQLVRPAAPPTEEKQQNEPNEGPQMPPSPNVPVPVNPTNTTDQTDLTDLPTPKPLPLLQHEEPVKAISRPLFPQPNAVAEHPSAAISVHQRFFLNPKGGC